MTTTDGAARGFRWILLATAVAGALGYVTQLLAPALLDPAAYVAFSVVWSTIYLCVSAMSGIQQEVTRASHRSSDHEPNTVLRTFTLITGAAVVVVSCILGIALGVRAVPVSAFALSGILAIGLAGYLLTAVLGGVLYGLHLWRHVALLTIVDAALRTAMLVIAFFLQLPVIWLACAVAFPFGLAFLAIWATSRRRVVGGFVLDVPLGGLIRNVLSTVGAAACTGAMISGLPLLIGLTGTRESPAALGAVMLAITLSRAPIVVPILAFQSFLISAVFRGRARASPRRILALLTTALGTILFLAILAFFVGPFLIHMISSGRYSIEAGMMAVIVASAGLVGLMCITGPALVAERKHSVNIAGWATAAVFTVLSLMLPLDLMTRIDIALALPPCLGLVIHLVALLRPVRPARPSVTPRFADSSPLD
ncbi:hypothetical protein [Microbacterium aurantiacum]|uniref:hypothetical protein n=1 Tax=Microbacterium aurantiacum TaxID=162393 RepID=UPI000C80B1DF|nr:hypothetical protein [Microbacterium aurantiacum]